MDDQSQTSDAPARRSPPSELALFAWLLGIAASALAAHFVALGHGASATTSVTASATLLGATFAVMLLIKRPVLVSGPWITMLLATTLLAGFSGGLLMTREPPAFPKSAGVVTLADLEPTIPTAQLQQLPAIGTAEALEDAVAQKEATLPEAEDPDAPQHRVALARSLLALAAIRDAADQPALLTRAQNLLNGSWSMPGLTIDQRRDLRLVHGTTLRRLGQLRRDAAVLRLAMSGLQQALDESEDPVPHTQRGAILNELALAERWLAILSGDESYLTSAVSHYLAAREALLVAGSEDSAGIVSNNLLKALALFDKGPPPEIPFATHLTIIDTAITATDKVSDALEWSRLNIARGDLLMLAGVENLDAERFQQAVESLTAGLIDAQTDGRTPREWALAQNQLANALQALGQARNDPDIVGEALKARRNAWVLYQYAGMGQYQFYFEDRIAALEQLLQQMTGANHVPPGLETEVLAAEPYHSCCTQDANRTVFSILP